MLKKRYARWMYDWEYRLTTRDENRVVRPLEWGFEWLEPFLEAHGLAGALRELEGRFSGAKAPSSFEPSTAQLKLSRDTKQNSWGDLSDAKDRGEDRFAS